MAPAHSTMRTRGKTRKEENSKQRNVDKMVKVKWNSCFSSLVTGAYEMFRNQKYVDVSVACEGQIIKCHRLILAAASSYFDSMLSNFNEKMVLYIAGVRFWELEALISFIYTGEVNIRQEDVTAFIQAGVDLQVKGLCFENLSEYIGEEGELRLPATPPDELSMTMPMLKKEIEEEEEENDHLEEQPSNLPDQLDQLKSQIGKIKSIMEIKKEIEDEEPFSVPVPNPAYNGNGKGSSSLLDLAKIKSEPMDVSEDEGIQLENTQKRPVETEEVNESNKKDRGSEILPKSDNPKDLLEKSTVSTADEEMESDYEPVPQSNKRRRSKRVIYPLEVRQASVQDLLNGMQLNECAVKYGVPKKTLSNWKSKHLKELAALPKKKEVVVLAESPTSTSNLPRDAEGQTGQSGLDDDNSSKRRSYVSNGSALPPIEGTNREELLQNAAKLVVDQFTNVRGAAFHYGLPRTTLSNYMRRNGLIHLRIGCPDSGPFDQKSRIGSLSSAPPSTNNSATWTQIEKDSNVETTDSASGLGGDGLVTGSDKIDNFNISGVSGEGMVGAANTTS